MHSGQAAKATACLLRPSLIAPNLRISAAHSRHPGPGAPLLPGAAQRRDREPDRRQRRRQQSPVRPPPQPDVCCSLDPESAGLVSSCYLLGCCRVTADVLGTDWHHPAVRCSPCLTDMYPATIAGASLSLCPFNSDGGPALTVVQQQAARCAHWRRGTCLPSARPPCAAAVQGAVHAHGAALQHGDAHRAVHPGEAAARPAAALQGSHHTLCLSITRIHVNLLRALP